MIVAIVSDPRGWEHWEQAETYLEPARARGDFDSVLDDDESLFAVMDGEELLGVATTWLSVHNFVQIKLVGGRDHKRWLKQLDEVIGACAEAAGADSLRADGRSGWRKALTAQGWDYFFQPPDTHCYQRRLKIHGQEKV